MAVELRLLGPLRAARNGADVALSGLSVRCVLLAALCAEFPFRESLWEKRMLALYRRDRQADALAAFHAARAALVDAIGIEPGRRLRDLERAILTQDAGLRGRAPAGAVADGRRVLVAAEPDELSPLVELAAALAGGELVAATARTFAWPSRGSGPAWRDTTPFPPAVATSRGAASGGMGPRDQVAARVPRMSETRFRDTRPPRCSDNRRIRVPNARR